LLSVACAFGCVHVWQTRESTSHRLGGLIGDGRFFVVASGRVISEPTPYGSSKERFILQVERIEMEGKELRPSAPVAVVIEAPAPARGDRVTVAASIQRIPPPRNPEEFNAKAWMAQQGITCEMEVSSPRDLTVTKAGSKYSLFSVATRACRWMEQTLRLGISGDPVVCDLLAGMVLGVTSSIPDSLQQEFRNTGTFHLFSVSGLHVGMIGLILWQALKIAGIQRRWAVALIIPALFFYALLTGWKPSSLRAAVMSAIFLIGMTTSRHALPFNSLCAAAFLILVQWTNEVFNPGFQLSFLVVAAILLLALPLHERIRKHCHPDPFIPRQLWTKWQKRSAEAVEKLGGLASVSLAAWLGSFPLTLFYFHMVSLSALPTNLVIVPLAFVIMATASLALLGGVFWGTLAAIFNNANWVFCKLLLAVVHYGASLPGSFVYVGSPAPAPVSITVFDFGAGGGTAVECDGKVWLLDCGSKWQLDGVITPWLHSRGKSTPDGLLLTHGDARHLGAALELIRRDPPAKIIESVLEDRSTQRKLVHKILQELGIPKSPHRAGDQVRLSENVRIKILYPPSGILRDTADDKALVVRLETGRARILFLSDSGPPTQEWLMRNAASELRADIVIKGMHHSGISMDAAFVDAVRPGMIITTASHFPENEPVSEEWIGLMTARGIRVFRQDLSGAVTINLHPSYFQATGYFDGVSYSSPWE
ncbi:MAG: ComEC/Rec2 family competence protein, partial [Terrimicrobiaceae bacterium]